MKKKTIFCIIAILAAVALCFLLYNRGSSPIENGESVIQTNIVDESSETLSDQVQEDIENLSLVPNRIETVQIAEIPQESHPEKTNDKDPLPTVENPLDGNLPENDTPIG